VVQGQLPPDGEALIGGVPLPGHRVRIADSRNNPIEPVAWVSDGLVEDAGLIWLALSEVQPDTGLVPVLVDDASDLDEFDTSWSLPQPPDPGFLTGENILAIRWEGRIGADDEDDPYFAGLRAPFSRQFPGLSLGGDSQLSKAQASEVLAGLPPAWIALVPAERPADVMAVLHWVMFDDFLGYATPEGTEIPPPLWIAAVLRSWEDRFGARLLKIGPGAEIRLLVERPPASRDSAQLIAAEHFAFADECDDIGNSSVAEITEAIVGAPTWQFWWD